MKNKISVAIVTRNRASDLIQCLGALVCQSQKPDELLIIDNNSTDKTKSIVQHFSRAVSFPVRYIKEQTIGYTYACNKALRSATYEWLAFIDDDCIPTSSWIKEMKHYIKKYPQMSVFVGQAIPSVRGIPELSMNFIDDIGKIQNITSTGNITDLEIVDPKCSIFNLSFIRRHAIAFNETVHIQSSDCDLGMQIQQKKGCGLYTPKIIISHTYPHSYSSYYKKLYIKTWNHLKYEYRWTKYRKKQKIEYHKNIMNVLHHYFKYSKHYKLSLFQYFLFLNTVALSYGIVKIFRLFFLFNRFLFKIKSFHI